MMTPKYVLGEARRTDRFMDLTDKRFGRLSAVRQVFKPERGGCAFWICLCDCGKTKVINGQSLRNGRTNSCGCLGVERRRAATTIHGHGSLRSRNDGTAYNSWYAMKQRCGNPNNCGFAGYGGRGITYDPRWAEFSAFLADMGERPENNQLDRIDNNGNYEKTNCRWSTPRDNCNNKNNKRLVNFNGRMLTYGAIADESGLNESTVRSRVDKCNWPIDRIGDPLKRVARLQPKGVAP